MTENVATRLKRKRKTQAEKQRKIRLCLLAVLLLSGCGALLFHNGGLSLLRDSLNWLKQSSPVEEVIGAAPCAVRGNIYDRNFRPLAATYKTYAVCARPLEMENPADSAPILAEILGLKESSLLKSLKSERGFIWIAKGIDPETAGIVKQKNIKGIYQVVETNRYYPNADLAAHAVGFVENGQGLDGIEFHYNAILRGDDLSGTELASLNVKPNSELGKSRTHLVLNLDLMLQAKIENFLKKRMRSTGAASGTALLMNADTGALYALASFPSFDPNRYWEFPSIALKNHALAEPVFPGELALIIQEAAALNKLHGEKTDPADEMQYITLNRVTITPEKKKRRRTSVAPHIDYVEPDYLTGFTRSLGFARKLSTDLSLKDETPATLSLDIRDNSFSTSALRLLSGLTALVNDGRLVTPHLLYRAYQNDSSIPFDFCQNVSENKSVLNPGVSKDLKEFLASKWLKLPRGALRSETPMFFESRHYATRPKDPAFHPLADADHTSTIQIPYLDQIVMFGAIPGRKPKLTMIAVLTYADNHDEVHPDLLETYGKSFSFLIPPEKTVEKIVHVTGMEPPNPARGFWDTETNLLAKNKSLRPLENNRDPSPADGLDKTMPDVTGKSLRAGLQVLQHFNLDIKLVGSGRIHSQQPAAGTRLTDISECVLTMQQEI
jgi:hypothetical protein